MKKDVLGLVIAHIVNFSLIEAVLGYAQCSYILTWVSNGENGEFLETCHTAKNIGLMMFFFVFHCNSWGRKVWYRAKNHVSNSNG